MHIFDCVLAPCDRIKGQENDSSPPKKKGHTMTNERIEADVRIASFTIYAHVANMAQAKKEIKKAARQIAEEHGASVACVLALFK